MAKRYWLMKCEPEAYTIEDLERDGTTTWEGVRNFQARNTMRDDMKVGDGVLFYASNAEPSGVSGVAAISREGYPDPYSFEVGHKYFDPKSDPANPTWYMVAIRFVEKFPEIISLATLKETPGLEKMVVTQKGSRLSVQPVTREEFDIVLKLGRKKARKGRQRTAAR
jgi:predicted RNA-binding protein with PUA-like domain